MFDLTGRRALVTGSSRGIGRAIAMALAGHGAHVCIHSADPEPEASEAVVAIAAQGGTAAELHGDLSEAAVVDGLLGKASTALGGAIDLLILNAAIQVPQPLGQIDRETATRQFHTNMLASIGLIQAALPDMSAQRFGRIVLIGSVQQWRPHPNMAVYAGLKSGLKNVARNFAVQLAPRGITVNTVAPGTIETDRNRAALSDPAYRAEVEAAIPARRLGEAADCAGVVVMLCSPAGDYITGANIPVDGGMHLG